MNLVPTVIEKNNHSERVYDIYSRLLKDRIIILSGEINDDNANAVVAELLYLDSVNHNDISIYINSPGGSVLLEWLFMIQLTLLKVMSQLSVLEWLLVWVHFYYQVEQMGKDIHLKIVK